MDTIGRTGLWSFFDSEQFARPATNTQIRKGPGHFVKSYLDLATKIAELQFRNREHVLLFRGQNADYLNKEKNTSLKPTLMRSEKGSNKIPTASRLDRRFLALRTAEEELEQLYLAKQLLGSKRLRRQRILRWALLQHYEICKTPLLDLTQSLRIAASFASIGAGEKAFVFALGVPNLSGSVTASNESGLQIVRLSSACPPAAVRPHIQEGYLLGEYPDMGDFSQKENYKHYEIDFGRRLIAKFCFKPKLFWKKDIFPLVRPDALYPNSIDPIFHLTREIALPLYD